MPKTLQSCQSDKDLQNLFTLLNALDSNSSQLLKWRDENGEMIVRNNVENCVKKSFSKHGDWQGLRAVDGAEAFNVHIKDIYKK